MILELSTNICPIIDVGLYQSKLSPENMFDRLDTELLCSEAVTDSEKDYFFDRIEFCFNTAKYKELIAKQCQQVKSKGLNCHCGLDPQSPYHVAKLGGFRVKRGMTQRREIKVHPLTC